MESQHHKELIRWQTRHLAFFIASTIPIQKGKRNPLADLANTLTFRPKKQEDEPFDPENPFGPQPEPQKGSFENFMGMFGKSMPG